MSAVLRVFAHNARNRTAEIAVLERLVADFDAFALTEAAHLHNELAAFARRHGLTLLQEAPIPWRNGQTVPEHGDVALLIRNGADVKHNRVRAMRKRWTSPVHGRLHQPRRGRRARVVVNGHPWRIAVDHWPTQHPASNGEAVAEAMRAARRWLRRGIWAPSVLVGDLNMGARDLNAWCARFATAKGFGPDNALGRRCAVEAERLEKFGSDHHAVAYTFTR